MLDWLRDIKLPAVVVVGIVAAFISGYVYLHTNFVSAASFDNYQSQVERRILMRRSRRLRPKFFGWM